MRLSSRLRPISVRPGRLGTLATGGPSRAIHPEALALEWVRRERNTAPRRRSPEMPLESSVTPAIQSRPAGRSNDDGPSVACERHDAGWAAGHGPCREARELSSRPDFESHPRRIFEEPRDPLREQDGTAHLLHPIRAVPALVRAVIQSPVRLEIQGSTGADRVVDDTAAAKSSRIGSIIAE